MLEYHRTWSVCTNASSNNYLQSGTYHVIWEKLQIYTIYFNLLLWQSLIDNYNVMMFQIQNTNMANIQKVEVQNK